MNRTHVMDCWSTGMMHKGSLCCGSFHPATPSLHLYRGQMK